MSDDHHVKRYIKIWLWLLGLFVLSLLAAIPGMLILTLVSAFAIALVKAGMVTAWFMHLNTEKRYIWYLFFSCLALMGLFYMAIFPDLGRMEGTNWVNTAPHGVAKAVGGHGDDADGDDVHGEDVHDGAGHATSEHTDESGADHDESDEDAAAHSDDAKAPSN